MSRLGEMGRVQRAAGINQRVGDQRIVTAKMFEREIAVPQTVSTLGIDQKAGKPLCGVCIAVGAASHCCEPLQDRAAIEQDDLVSTAIAGWWRFNIAPDIARVALS